MTTESKTSARKKRIQKELQATLIAILIVLTICMMLDVEKIQGTARVVNYAGIVRGATQRLMKLEMAGQESDELQQNLDDIFSGLMHGGGKYNLTKLDNKDYQDKLNIQYEYWKKLKKEVQAVRTKGYEQTDIINMSEEYFQLADNTVDAAEKYSQHSATRVSQIEKALIIVMILIVILLIKQSVEEVMLMKKNRELRKKAYIDIHTGLPNKSKCEELFMDGDYLPPDTALVIFDLNGLKNVNDTLGHIAGDALIMNFANIIRTSIPEQHFVGRYGGDEFIAILKEVNEEQLKAIIDEIQKNVDTYNQFSKQMHMEFAHGYAISNTFQHSNLKILLENADKKMYQRKAAMKGGNVR